MIKKTLITLLLSIAISQAAVEDLIPSLASDDLNIQTQARLDLLAVCSEAGKPDNEQARKETCLEICKILGSKQDDVLVMHQMLLNLERIGGAESVPTLVKLLNHKEEFIRDDARRALAVNSSSEAAQALGARLKMRKARSAEETAGLIYALGERKQVGASKLIVASLKSQDEDVFIAAVKTLGLLNEPVGIQALIAQRAKEGGFRKVQVEAALLSTGNKAVLEGFCSETETEQIRSVALLGLILQGDTAKASEAMESGVAGLQVAVIEAALQGKDKTVFDVVAAQIDALPVHIQLQAVAALEFSGDSAYASAIEPLLKSSDYQIQVNAARALGRIGAASSVQPLLESGSVDARRALGMLNVDGADKALEDVAANSTDDNLRAVAIDALANRGRRDLMPQFFVYADEGGKKTSKSAVKAIGAVGDFSNLADLTDLMIKKEADPVSRDILSVIVDILRSSTQGGEAVGVLVSKMEGASARSQANILQAMAKSGSPQAMKPILESCRSSDEKLQKQAVKLMGGWPNENGIDPMIELAADESLSLVNHVTIMRGVSRLMAEQRYWVFKEATGRKALEACRRDEERKMVQEVVDKQLKQQKK